MEPTSLIAFPLIGLVAGWLAGTIMSGGGFGLIGSLRHRHGGCGGPAVHRRPAEEGANGVSLAWAKSIASGAVLAVFAVLAGEETAWAEADGPDYFAVQGVAAGDVLNIRAAPAANSAAIGQVPHDGRGLQNLGCQGGPTFAAWQTMSEAERTRAGRKRWCRIRYQGVEGWVAGWFLVEDSDAAPR